MSLTPSQVAIAKELVCHLKSMQNTSKENKMTDRVSRSAESRESKTRRKPWQPPSMLDALKRLRDTNTGGFVQKLEVTMIERICLNVFGKDLNL